MPAAVTFDYTFTNNTPADADQVMSNLEKLRVRANESVRGGAGMLTIAGWVSSAGVVQAVGDNGRFTAARIGLGHYRITFTTPFTAPAIVVANVVNNGASPYNAQVSDPDATIVDVWTSSISGVADVQFSFIAIGPAA